MLILWAAMATATVVVLLLVEWAFRLRDGREMGEGAGPGADGPGTISAGPVVVVSCDALGEGRGEAAA
jgi:hypothetical protein